VPGNRGTDYRIEGPSTRVGATERKALRKARRQPFEGEIDGEEI